MVEEFRDRNFDRVVQAYDLIRVNRSEYKTNEFIRNLHSLYFDPARLTVVPSTEQLQNDYIEYKREVDATADEITFFHSIWDMVLQDSATINNQLHLLDDATNLSNRTEFYLSLNAAKKRFQTKWHAIGLPKNLNLDPVNNEEQRVLENLLRKCEQDRTQLLQNIETLKKLLDQEQRKKNIMVSSRELGETESTSEFEQLQEQQKNLNQQLMEANNQIVLLNQEVESYRNTRDALDEVRKKEAQLMAEIEMLQQELSQQNKADEELALTKSQLNSMEEKVKYYENFNNQELQTREEEYLTTEAQLRDEIESLQQELSRIKLDEELASAKSQLNTMEQELNYYKRVSSEQSQNIDYYKNNQSQLLAQNEILVKELNNNKFQLEELKQKLEKLSSEQLQPSNPPATTETKLLDNIKKLEGKLTKTKTQLKEVEEKLKQCQSHNTAQSVNQSQLLAQNETLQKELNEVNQQLEKLKNEQVRNRRANTETKLREKVKRLEEKEARQNEALANTKEELTNTKSDLDDVRKKFNDCNRNNQELLKAMEEKSTTNEPDLRNQIEQLNQELQKCQLQVNQYIEQANKSKTKQDQQFARIMAQKDEQIQSLNQEKNTLLQQKEQLMDAVVREQENGRIQNVQIIELQKKLKEKEASAENEQFEEEYKKLLQKYNQEKDLTERKIASLENEVTAAIEEIRTRSATEDRLRDAVRPIDILQRQLKAIQSEVLIRAETEERLRKDIRSLNNTISLLQKQLREEQNKPPQILRVNDPVQNRASQNELRERIGQLTQIKANQETEIATLKQELASLKAKIKNTNSKDSKK